MKILNKITIKNVTGGIKGNPEKMRALLDRPAAILYLASIIGQVNGVKEIVKEFEDGKTQTSLKFKGSFKATNLETGEVFRSGVCYLPEVAANLVGGAMSDESSAIQFGFRIGAKYDDTSATQYVYVVESLMEAAENDPVELLEKVLQPKLLGTTVAPEAPPAGEKLAEQPVIEPDTKKAPKKEKATV